MNSDLLEATNAVTAVLLLEISILFIIGVIRSITKYKLDRPRRVAGMLSMVIMFGSTGIVIFIKYWARYVINNPGIDGFLNDHQDIIILVGSIISALSALIVIKVWSDDSWGYWPVALGTVTAGALAFGGPLIAAGAALSVGVVWGAVRFGNLFSHKK